MFKCSMYAALMLIAYSISGCLATVYHLYVEDHPTIYNMGVEYVKDEAGGIEVSAAFIENYDNMYVFDMTITNYANSPVRVEPESFYYMRIDTIGNFQDDSKTFAYNPERKIIEYEKLRKKKYHPSEQAEYERAMDKLEIEKKLWKDDALRKVDLNPGEYIRGNVYFPVARNAVRIKMYINVGDSAINMTYKQQIY